MSGRGEMWLFLAQRASAVVMAPLVLIHLTVIIYAVRSGLSAEAIFARTRGSVLWAGFYGLFVVAVSVHAALGCRAISAEWAGWRGKRVDGVWAAFGALLLIAGLRAVAGVIW